MVDFDGTPKCIGEMEHVEHKMILGKKDLIIGQLYMERLQVSIPVAVLVFMETSYTTVIK